MTGHFEHRRIPSSQAGDDAHINASIQNEQRRSALAELDDADFSWFLAKVCVVAGAGFFTDAYDVFAIGTASKMLGFVYGHDQMLSRHQELGIKLATPVRTLVGQLLFGWLADRVGRKRMYGVELMIIISATLLQTLSGNSAAVNIIGVLALWRFLMGVGIGGDYPLSSIITSEFAPVKTRGRMMTAVFAAQGGGNFTAALVAFVITARYKDAFLAQTSLTQLDSVDSMWRLLIGLGCIPGVIALYFRLTIPEPPRFTMDIQGNMARASRDIKSTLNEEKTYTLEYDGTQSIKTPKASWADFRAYFGQWRNFKLLFATAYSWFALDIAFYGLGLNSSAVLDAIGLLDARITKLESVQDAYDTLWSTCIRNLVLSAALIPGYWVSFLFIDSWGRKRIQLMGFTALTILFVVLGFGCDKLLTTTNPSKKAFLFLYFLANFFQNFGPNTTTFIIPGEIFPTRYRATAHGISAASGKLGAIIAQIIFDRLKDKGDQHKSLGRILLMFAFFMLTGIGSTLLLPETKQKSLEVLSNEEQVGFINGPV